MNLTINAFGTDNMIKASEQSMERMGAKNPKQSIYVGDSNLANDPIAQRRKEAQEKAWNIVKRAWDSDKAVDDMIQVRRDHYAELTALKEEATAELVDIEEDKEALREIYGVELDSQEQKDLELLEKAQNINAGVSDAELTDEERKRLVGLYQGELTEYQSRALEMNDRAVELKKRIANADKQMRDDIADINAIEQERLKENPMVEAQDAASDLLDAANKEIIGMLVQESKEHIDEKMEENEGKAEKNAKEQEEQEERLEEQKLNRAVQEAMIEGTKEAVEKAKAMERRMKAPEMDTLEMIEITEDGSATSDVSQSLDEIKSSMNLLEADLKGIKVDEEA